MRKIVIALLPLMLGGCLEQNLGLESQHKPIVAEGRAQVRGCPDWSSQGVDSAAGTDSNYGCATNANLAAMVGNPADVEHGATAAPGDSSDVAAHAITSWRASSGAGASSGGSSTSAAAPKGGQ